MHVKKDDLPLLANPYDQMWVVFRDQPTYAILWVQALTDGAVVTVADGTSDNPAFLSAPTTLTFVQAGTIQLVQLPVSSNPLNQYVQIVPTTGRVSATVAAPSEFRFYLKAPQT
jgi:hypothetical protein